MFPQVADALIQALDHRQEVRFKDQIVAWVVEHALSRLQEREIAQTMRQLRCMCKEVRLSLTSTCDSAYLLLK